MPRPDWGAAVDDGVGLCCVWLLVWVVGVVLALSAQLSLLPLAEALARSDDSRCGDGRRDGGDHAERGARVVWWDDGGWTGGDWFVVLGRLLRPRRAAEHSGQVNHNALSCRTPTTKRGGLWPRRQHERWRTILRQPRCPTLYAPVVSPSRSFACCSPGARSRASSAVSRLTTTDFALTLGRNWPTSSARAAWAPSSRPWTGTRARRSPSSRYVHRSGLLD